MGRGGEDKTPPPPFLCVCSFQLLPMLFELSLPRLFSLNIVLSCKPGRMPLSEFECAVSQLPRLCSLNIVLSPKPGRMPLCMSKLAISHYRTQISDRHAKLEITISHEIEGSGALWERDCIAKNCGVMTEHVDVYRYKFAKEKGFLPGIAITADAGCRASQEKEIL